MLTLVVNIAVIQANQIILIKREDFEVWSLPGGHVDAGESVAQAAIRETREETGLEVELTSLVGIYSVPGHNGHSSHAVLFSAKPIGGTLRWSEDEVLEARYFDPNHLPEPLIWLHRQRIADALNGLGGGIVRLQQVDWPFESDMTRETLYQLRDQSGLSRQAFYLRYFGQNQIEDGKLEVK
jgi:ADP-ribose pyrophosphatase YjhB (NUDIX family)